MPNVYQQDEPFPMTKEPLTWDRATYGLTGASLLAALKAAQLQKFALAKALGSFALTGPAGVLLSDIIEPKAFGDVDEMARIKDFKWK